MVDEVEEWRAVVGYEGLYEVSALGRVRSCERWTRPGKGHRRVSSRILRPRLDKDGYQKVTLSRDGRGRNTSVHVVVLKTFVGPRPPGYEGLHGDGDPANSRLSNLRWGTSSENKRDTQRHGRQIHGERHYRAKITETQVAEIRAKHAQGRTKKSLEAEFGVSDSQIDNIVRGRSWRHVPMPEAAS